MARHGGGMRGVENEDQIELSKEQQQAVKLRSRKLLFSLIKPVRARLVFSFVLVIISQAFRVVGPMLIAFAIDAMACSTCTEFGFAKASFE